jgi:hypothetical protein
MSADRYLRIVLTVVAVELGWIAVKDVAAPVSAQQAQPMPVIIRGVEGAPGKEVFIPVTIVGATGAVKVASDQPIQIEAPQPLRIEATRPIVVETAERALLVQSVPSVPAPRPGP